MKKAKQWLYNKICNRIDDDPNHNIKKLGDGSTMFLFYGFHLGTRVEFEKAIEIAYLEGQLEGARNYADNEQFLTVLNRLEELTGE